MSNEDLNFRKFLYVIKGVDIVILLEDALSELFIIVYNGCK